MRFYLISDNEDTLVGMRLAGIDGTMVGDETEALQELNKAMKRVDDVAVVLVTQNVVDMIPETVYNLKMNCKRPLIVEVPDRNGNGRTKDAITRYVREAVGIKI
jgi:V/A-type H+-transporting ATPase subunit F